MSRSSPHLQNPIDLRCSPERVSLPVDSIELNKLLMGTNICVAPGQLDIVIIVIDTIDRLELSDRDLSWIHPDYEQEFQRSLKSNQNLVP
jgi:hypothetical protein